MPSGIYMLAVAEVLQMQLYWKKEKAVIWEILHYKPVHRFL